MSFLERMKQKSREIAAKASEAISQDILADNADERMAICEACPHLRKPINQCAKCGCMMNLKTKLAGARCPIGKW